jgi:hypothetical protein
LGGELEIYPHFGILFFLKTFEKAHLFAIAYSANVFSLPLSFNCYFYHIFSTKVNSFHSIHHAKGLKFYFIFKVLSITPAFA